MDAHCERCDFVPQPASGDPPPRQVLLFCSMATHGQAVQVVDPGFRPVPAGQGAAQAQIRGQLLGEVALQGGETATAVVTGRLYAES